MIGDALKGALRALLYVFSYLWIVWWGIGIRVRHAITGIVGVISIAGLVVSGLRIVLAASGIEPGQILALRPDVAGPARFHERAVEWLLAPPLWVYGLLLVLVVLAIVNKHRENQNVKRRPRLAAATRVLLDEAVALKCIDRTAPDGVQRTNSYIEKVLSTFQFVLEDVSKLNLNVMTPDASGALRIQHKVPKDASYDAKLTLASGEGGAGRAWKERSTVYVPNRKHHHGIMIRWSHPKNPRDHESNTECEFSLVPDAFRPSASDPFKCILSCPVRTRERVVGVLNFNAGRASAFSEAHFLIAEVAAGFIAFALDDPIGEKEREHA